MSQPPSPGCEPLQGYYPTAFNGQYPPAPPGQVPPVSSGPGFGQPAPGYSPPYGYKPQENPPPAYGHGQPIINQPMGPPGHAGEPDGWINIPQEEENCPPGLEYLTMIDQLLVQQKVELLEVLTGFETKNKFIIKNSLGQKIYYAKEDSDRCTRNCWGPMRPFDMKILDNYKKEVIHLYRPLACSSCCFPCCLQSMEVFSPPGTIIGTIEQEWAIFCSSFLIKNANGDTVLQIKGPFCTFSICGDVEFKVMSADGSTQIGKIAKQWSGLLREMLTDADFFGFTFPIDVDVRMKALMLGTCFLIDIIFFETSESAI